MQVIGKDILRFHAAIWPGMLLALGLPLPERLYVHGFINAEGGGKMSKSLGNVIDPTEVVARYSADVFRYYVLRHIPSHGDGDFSWEKLESVYTTELGNELGNAVQRTAAMIKRYQNGIIGQIPPASHDIGGYREAMKACRFDRALEEVWDQVRGLNQYIEEEKPWQIFKTGDADNLRDVLARQVSNLLEIADLLVPFLPDTAQKIHHIFDEGVVRLPEQTLFPRKDSVEA